MDKLHQQVMTVTTKLEWVTEDNYNANDGNFAMATYLNQGSGSRGIRIINDTANDRIDIEYLSNGDQSVTRTDVTDTRITNVPHTGRFYVCDWRGRKN